MNYHKFGAGMLGWIEVIVGSMFSGKTSEAINRGSEADRAKQVVAAFKHANDKRYHPTDLVSHSGARLPGFAVTTVEEMEQHITAATQVIVIDEAQFFGPEIVDFVRRHRASGKRIIISGLNTDYQGNPFGPMPILLAIANETMTKIAICTVCNGPASFSHRLTPSKAQVEVGEADKYAARCEHDWDPNGTPAPEE